MPFFEKFWDLYEVSSNEDGTKVEFQLAQTVGFSGLLGTFTPSTGQRSGNGQIPSSWDAQYTNN